MAGSRGGPARGRASHCTRRLQRRALVLDCQCSGAENRLELTIEELADGEVSPYLAEMVAPGDPLEIRGPIGGWFVWQPVQTEPVQLVAGGSGIVPLMAMIRTRAKASSSAPFRLLYSVRSPQSIIYADELKERAEHDAGLGVTYAYTRIAPDGWPTPPQRIDAHIVGAAAFAPERKPLVLRVRADAVR